ncbi:hypothetical protein POM88_052879 [Heracleum sosnowskyi]|uniref:Uncharacterized protein n=1 Tax=Heracleum sosnowskyi TaxID=360622 RepID=A0AAD8LXQ9_9APIA|nr:hypothetical protein POM88_052879 [Heracleum sosnowskyi]
MGLCCWVMALWAQISNNGPSGQNKTSPNSIPRPSLVYDAVTETRYLNASNREMCAPNDAQNSLDIPNSENKMLRQLLQFTFQELKSATGNFRPDSMLGGGGFGFIFKGWIEENGNSSKTWIWNHSCMKIEVDSSERKCVAKETLVNVQKGLVNGFEEEKVQTPKMEVSDSNRESRDVGSKCGDVVTLLKKRDLCTDLHASPGRETSD